MASHVVVIDTSFRRTTIKVSPGKYISDILEEACLKFGLNASNYGIKNNNKAIDLSRNFRQTGLSSGAKLELVVASRSPSVVSIALQLPEIEAKNVPGGRLVDKFPSSTTLWMILRRFETGGTKNLNFTGRGVAQTTNGESRAGKIFYEIPMLNIMGRELSSFTDLQKTLQQLGLNSGSNLIRLNFRITETPLEEAMEEIDKYFQSIDDTVAPGAPSGAEMNMQSAPEDKPGPVSDAVAGEPIPDKSTAINIDPPESSGSSDHVAAALTPATPSEASVPEDVIIGPNQRPISVFAAPNSNTPMAALRADNDDDYEPTVAHAKLHQQRLQVKSQNQRLPSDAELQRQAEEKAAKDAAITEVSIKIRFPDQLTVISGFTTSDTGLTLYDFVRGVITTQDHPWTLGWVGPKGPQTIPDDPKVRLMKDLGFTGRMLVNFNWEDASTAGTRQKTLLKGEFASKAKELQIQEIAAAEAQHEAAKADKAEKEAGGARKGKKGLPKWLKLPGKK